MTPEEIETFLRRSLDDGNLSRGERQSLNATLSALDSVAASQTLLKHAFALVRERVEHPEAAPSLDWLEAVVLAVRAGRAERAATIAEAHFSPGDDCLDAILRSLRHASRSADICVFTITDDRISEAIIAAHHRGVSIRIVSDDQKAEDLGSDVPRFEQVGIAVRVDRSPFHMHHKFAVLDGGLLLTGSYNWTRGAARDNEENLTETNEPRLVKAFSTAFDRLWNRLADASQGHSLQQHGPT
jgi:phosphatidylserine/phosphatidylglycerophosphate/cardiolipin synthase-like enzyme